MGGGKGIQTSDGRWFKDTAEGQQRAKQHEQFCTLHRNLVRAIAQLDISKQRTSQNGELQGENGARAGLTSPPASPTAAATTIEISAAEAFTAVSEVTSEDMVDSVVNVRNRPQRISTNLVHPGTQNITSTAIDPLATSTAQPSLPVPCVPLLPLGQTDSTLSAPMHQPESEKSKHPDDCQEQCMEHVYINSPIEPAIDPVLSHALSDTTKAVAGSRETSASQQASVGAYRRTPRYPTASRRSLRSKQTSKLQAQELDVTE